MSNNKNRPAGIGTGYLSLMMIFVVLCLTILAALSFSAAENGKKYSVKSAEYTAEYYAADLAAKRVLAEIDEFAAEYDDYSDFMFLAELEKIDGISCDSVIGGVEISWLTEINPRQNIYSRVKYSAGGAEILCWQTVSSGETEQAPLNVWQG